MQKAYRTIEANTVDVLSICDRPSALLEGKKTIRSSSTGTFEGTDGFHCHIASLNSGESYDTVSLAVHDAYVCIE